MKILITSASTSEAYRIKNKLTGGTIIMGDYRELPEIMLRSGQMIKLPDPASSAYAHQMLALCLDKEIDTVYPLDDSEYQQLNEAALLFSEYGISILNYTDEL